MWSTLRTANPCMVDKWRVFIYFRRCVHQWGREVWQKWQAGRPSVSHNSENQSSTMHESPGVWRISRPLHFKCPEIKAAHSLRTYARNHSGDIFSFSLSAALVKSEKTFGIQTDTPSTEWALERGREKKIRAEAVCCLSIAFVHM